MPKPNPVPPGFHTVTPHLVVRDAPKAIDFYRRAFGAEEAYRIASPDGSAVLHAELRLGDSVIMLADENPAMGSVSPLATGSTSVTISLYVADTDALFARATGAGAKPALPPTDMFWGDRYAQVIDPFGHRWAIATHQKDLTPDEIRKAMAAAFGGK
jgi:uncharacterized glyoxalase superfamily protein PhnB